MAAPRLTKKQREALLTWISEGLETDEINDRAGAFDPPFTVARSTVTYYRQSRALDLAELVRTGQADALRTGLAVREERVRRLALLADVLEDGLFNGDLWLARVRLSGEQRVDYEEFNAAGVAQWRGLLDDIAKEIGDRRQGVDVAGRVELVKGYATKEESPDAWDADTTNPAA